MGDRDGGARGDGVDRDNDLFGGEGLGGADDDQADGIGGFAGGEGVLSSQL